MCPQEWRQAGALLGHEVAGPSHHERQQCRAQSAATVAGTHDTLDGHSNAAVGRRAWREQRGRHEPPVALCQQPVP